MGRSRNVVESVTCGIDCRLEVGGLFASGDIAVDAGLRVDRFPRSRDGGSGDVICKDIGVVQSVAEAAFSETKAETAGVYKFTLQGGESPSSGREEAKQFLVETRFPTTLRAIASNSHTIISSSPPALIK